MAADSSLIDILDSDIALLNVIFEDSDSDLSDDSEEEVLRYHKRMEKRLRMLPF
jgi:hypothetical protein